MRHEPGCSRLRVSPAVAPQALAGTGAARPGTERSWAPVMPAQCPSPGTDLLGCCLVQRVARIGASVCQHSFLTGKAVALSFRYKTKMASQAT